MHDEWGRALFHSHFAQIISTFARSWYSIPNLPLVHSLLWRRSEILRRSQMERLRIAQFLRHFCRFVQWDVTRIKLLETLEEELSQKRKTNWKYYRVLTRNHNCLWHGIFQATRTIASENGIYWRLEQIKAYLGLTLKEKFFVISIMNINVVVDIL